jgi:hypothetical protein
MSESDRPLEASVRAGLVVAMAFVLAPSGAFAHADDPTTTGAEAPQETAAPPIVVSGYVDTYYQYNVNQVPPSLRAFDVEHDALSSSLADVAASMPGNDSTEADGGKTAGVGIGRTRLTRRH